MCRNMAESVIGRGKFSHEACAVGKRLLVKFENFNRKKSPVRKFLRGYKIKSIILCIVKVYIMIKICNLN